MDNSALVAAVRELTTAVKALADVVKTQAETQHDDLVELREMLGHLVDGQSELVQAVRDVGDEIEKSRVGSL